MYLLQIHEYFIHIRHQLTNSPYVANSEINEDIPTAGKGFIKARINFTDGSVLSFREYVSTEIEPPSR